jgi:signal peptidase I
VGRRHRGGEGFIARAFVRVTVSANQYFVLGDNHSDACDSRSWAGVPRSDIIGKAFVRLWPLSRVAWL